MDVVDVGQGESGGILGCRVRLICLTGRPINSVAIFSIRGAKEVSGTLIPTVATIKSRAMTPISVAASARLTGRFMAD
jgi:hypothetical protein